MVVRRIGWRWNFARSLVERLLSSSSVLAVNAGVVELRGTLTLGISWKWNVATSSSCICTFCLRGRWGSLRIRPSNFIEATGERLPFGAPYAEELLMLLGAVAARCNGTSKA